MLVAEKSVPRSVEDFDTAWFNSFMDEKILDSRILKVINGTATKLHIELTIDNPNGAEKRTVWVKTGLEEHSADSRLGAIYAGEAFFYRTLGGQFETRTPHCYFAHTDETGHSAIVLDDLLTQGAEFVDPTKPANPELVAKAFEAIARWQAASWMNEELGKSSYLRSGGSTRTGVIMDVIYDPKLWADISQRPRFQALAPELRNREMLSKASRRLQDLWWPQAPWALSHGDCHFGQTYILPSGEVRMIDWQYAQLANWAHDVSFFLVGALSVEDRRKHERDLLNHHIAKLREFGLEKPPTEAEAYQAYRAYAMHGIAWVTCSVEMQPEENSLAMTERFSAAVMDLGSIDVVMSGPKGA